MLLLDYAGRSTGAPPRAALPDQASRQAMTRLWPEGEAITVQLDDRGYPKLLVWQVQTHPVQGAIRFAQAARTAGIQPIFGTELTLKGGHHLTLLVENATGCRNLCWLISRARHNAPKGQAALPPDELEGHTDGLIALSGCRQ